MKDLTSRQKQALITKGKIYDSACMLFAKHDYKDVTIQDICDDANVAVGVFYHYFSSKSAILDESFGFFYERLFNKLEEINEINPLDRIRNIIRIGNQIRQKRGRKFVSLALRYELSEANYYDKSPKNAYSLIYEAVTNAINHNYLFGDAKIISSDIEKASMGSTYEWIVRNDDSYAFEEEAVRTLNIVLAYYSKQPAGSLESD